MNKVYGIDLGTTYSVISELDEFGRPRVLDNDVDSKTTPSVVFFESADRVVVGAEAKRMQSVASDDVVSLIKNSMGTDSIVTFHGIAYTPEAISALILKYLVESVAGAGAAGVRAVITVPAYFGIAEREATQQAALIAGIEVLDLVPEPVAAAIAYGVDKAIGENVLVYDLGGGTFDTTVIALEEKGPRVVVTDGAKLGGADWDARLLSHIVERYVELVGPEGDPYDSAAFVSTVVALAEDAKKSLSSKTEVTLNLSFEGRRSPVVVTRAEFESITADLLATTVEVSERTIAAARAKGVSGVSRIVLVGGSSRMPAVVVALAERFGVEALLADPDFAVSKGAAIRAGFLGGRGKLAGGALSAPPDATPAGRGDSHGVVPRSVGVLIWDSFDPSGERRKVDHVVHANEQLPAAATVTYGTVLDGQDQVRVQVYEQAGSIESDELSHNRPVLDGLITGIPPLRSGSPIDVRLEIGDDGRLHVVAREPGSGLELELESFIEGVTDSEDVSRLTRVVAGLSVMERR